MTLGTIVAAVGELNRELIEKSQIKRKLMKVKIKFSTKDNLYVCVTNINCLKNKNTELKYVKLCNY